MFYFSKKIIKIMVLGDHHSKGSASEYNNNNNDGYIVEMGEDRLSELTDALLLHILSFIPSRMVVSTSILSTRWKNLWKSIQVLDFREWPFYDYDTYPNARVRRHFEDRKFMNFVEKVLSSLDNGSNIQKFYLEYDKAIDQSRFSEWITTVIRSNVEEINLSIEAKTVLFPPCFYTCESLTMLELRTDAILDLPESISFPRLKTLRLMNVKFVDENTTQQFFSNCHVLENLTLTRCHWEVLNLASISAPVLKFLYITGRRYPSGRDCLVKIYAPSLLSFWYLQGSAKGYILHNVSSLVDAEIDLNEINYGASELLSGLSHVKLLKMSGETFKALSLADDLVTNLPTFYNLIHLELHSRFPNGGDKVLLDFLQISPNLESLVFAEGIDYLSNDDYSGKLNSEPRLLLQHLKSIEFRAFDGRPRELKFVKLFLENAKVLEKMAIKMTITFRMNKSVEEVMEQLLMFRRGSTSCVIKIT